MKPVFAVIAATCLLFPACARAADLPEVITAPQIFVDQVEIEAEKTMALPRDLGLLRSKAGQSDWVAAAQLAFLCRNYAAFGCFSEADKWYAQVLEAVKPLAAQGDPAAQNELGYIYAQSALAAPANVEPGPIYQLALQSWWPAAQQGFPAAQYNVGLLFRGGLGVGKDPGGGDSWIFDASVNGFRRAQQDMSEVYRKGVTFSQDRGEAYYLRKLAGGYRADEQAIKAEAEAEYPAHLGKGQILSQDRRWLQQVSADATAGNLHAQLELAHWDYRQAAEKGDRNGWVQSYYWYRRATAALPIDYTDKIGPDGPAPLQAAMAEMKLAAPHLSFVQKLVADLRTWR